MKVPGLHLCLFENSAVKTCVCVFGEAGLGGGECNGDAGQM